jgi:isopenicillin-N epimerase
MADFKERWALEPGVDYLNHGSFGACPRAVLEHQSELRARMERQLIQFLARDLEGLLDEARGALGQFVGADPDGLAFVPNATAGVNTVVRSLDLQPGDEIVTTDHAYNSCRNALRWQEERGVKTVYASVPWPIAGPWQVVESVIAAVTPRTKLVMIDHITSPTGLIFPVAEIVTRLPGVDVLVDGAHAPGMLPLDLRKIGAAYYTGNCHKWLCTPKGSAFLYVRRDKLAGLKPLAYGHGLNSPRADRSRFRLVFDWAGTDDPTPFLCIPFALKYLPSLMPWPQLMERNHAMVVAGRRLLLDALNLPEPAPEFMLGSLASVPLPDWPGERPKHEGVWWHPFQKQLLQTHRIEAPVMIFPDLPRQLIRISAQLYNTLDQYSRLAEVLRHERP